MPLGRFWRGTTQLRRPYCRPYSHPTLMKQGRARRVNGRQSALSTDEHFGRPAQLSAGGCSKTAQPAKLAGAVSEGNCIEPEGLAFGKQLREDTNVASYLPGSHRPRFALKQVRKRRVPVVALPSQRDMPQVTQLTCPASCWPQPLQQKATARILKPSSTE